jgi:hypothetical protein
MTLVANSRERPISRRLARMGTLGNGNPASSASRTNSPPESLLGLGLVAKSLGQAVGLKNPANLLVQTPCAGFLFLWKVRSCQRPSRERDGLLKG